MPPLKQTLLIVAIVLGVMWVVFHVAIARRYVVGAMPGDARSGLPSPARR